MKEIKQKFIDILDECKSPQVLAWAISVGIVGGIFPLPGVTCIIVLLMAKLLNSHLPTSLFLNYVMTPVNIATVIPFIQFGEYTLSQESSELTSLIQRLQVDFLKTLQASLQSILCGFFAWFLLCPFLLMIIYWILLVILIRIKPQNK